MCDCEPMDGGPSHPLREAKSGSGQQAGVSRRAVLSGGLGAMAAAGMITTAQAQEADPSSPAINRNSVAGMPFRAFVRHGTEGGVVDLTLRDILPTQVVIRTKGSCGCYSITPTVLGTSDQETPMIPNHSGMGIVEAVGDQVRRVKVGDRVVVSGTPWCGQCYQCLNGAPERCNYLIGALQNDPIAQLADGTDVIEMSLIGGLSEIMVAHEEYLVPVFSDLPDEQVAMLGDTFAVGVGSVNVYRQVWGGANVVIFGAGPVGLAAVQGARANSAGQIIVVEPIPYRREKAVEFGATTVLDPNEDTDTLVERIRELCTGPAPVGRVDAGGRIVGGRVAVAGADHCVEATGGDVFVPKEPVGPDPTGLTAFRQAWEVTAPGGHWVTLGIFQQGEISFPTSQFSISAKHHHGGQMAGMNVMRDTPRYLRMAETGALDIGAMITARYPLEGVKEGFQKVADRTELGVVFAP